MEIKVCTFNLRNKNNFDKELNFPFRFPFIKEKITEEMPDVIGFQEITWDMRNDLINGLTDYYIVGGGRDADRLGEGVCVAFNKNKYTLNDCETFWLSETPNVPGSLYPEDQSIYARTCVSVLLTDNVTHDIFRFYVTHTDHEGAVARFRASEDLKKIVASRKNESFIITGDFNATPETPEIKVITNGEIIEIKDATEGITQTFHEFGVRKTMDSTVDKIDYIFHSADFVSSDVRIWPDKKDNLYLSDHYPISAILTK